MEASLLTSVILPASLFIIMLGMGLSLVLDDFRRVVKYPKATIIGLVNQLILLPLMAFAMVKVLGLAPLTAVGFMLIAACPGGVTSNLIAHVSKGDTALSITLTAISSFTTVITIPLIVSFSLSHFMDNSQSIQLPVGKTIIQILSITVIPVSIGMFIRNRFPDFAIKMDKPTRIASTIIFIIILVSVIATNLELVRENMGTLGWISLLLLMLTMALGFFSAKLFKLNLSQQISIAIESGIQNGALAIVIATTLLEQSELSLPAAIYSLVMFLPAGLIMWYCGGRKTKLT